MGQQKQASIPDELATVRDEIEHWRKTRRKRTPMPAALWSAAVSLAQAHGIYPVSRVLRIDYSSLRARLAESQVAGASLVGSSLRSSGFVELPPHASASVSPGVVGAELEIEVADGSRLSLRMADLDGLDVPGVVSAFRRRAG